MLKNVKYAIKALILLIKEYPLRLFTFFINTLVQVGMSLIPVYMVRSIVTHFNEGINFNNLLRELIIYIVIYLFLALVSWIVWYVSVYVQRNFQMKVAIMLYRKLEFIDYEFHENSIFLNNYTRALEESNSMIYQTAINILALIRMIIQSLAMFAIVATIDILAVYYSIGIGLVYIVIRMFTARLWFAQRTDQRPMFRKRNYVNRVFYVKDAMGEIKTTDVASVLFRNLSDLKKENVALVDKYAVKRNKLEFIGNSLLNSIYPITIGIVLFNTVDIVSFSVIITAAATISNLIRGVVDHIASLQETAPECKIPFELLEMKGKIECKEGNLVDEVKTISLNNVSFGYDEKKIILNNVSIKIEKNKKIAIVGHNGAGKTTLVKLLLRLYDVKEGSIVVNDDVYTNVNVESLRKKIGVVFQESEVYALTVAENVLLRRVETEEDKEIVIKALKFSGLYNFISSLEKGIDTIVTREFDTNGIVFSGGQKQKLAIARGYARGSEVLILDEPSSALDPLAEASLYKNMLELGKEKTLIFISHRLSTTANADYIYLLDNGCVKEEGTHEKLLKNKNGLYRKMFYSQASKYFREEENV